MTIDNLLKFHLNRIIGCANNGHIGWINERFSINGKGQVGNFLIYFNEINEKGELINKQFGNLEEILTNGEVFSKLLKIDKQNEIVCKVNGITGTIGIIDNELSFVKKIISLN